MQAGNSGAGTESPRNSSDRWFTRGPNDVQQCFNFVRPVEVCLVVLQNLTDRGGHALLIAGELPYDDEFQIPQCLVAMTIQQVSLNGILPGLLEDAGS